MAVVDAHMCPREITNWWVFEMVFSFFAQSINGRNTDTLKKSAVELGAARIDHVVPKSEALPLQLVSYLMSLAPIASLLSWRSLSD